MPAKGSLWAKGVINFYYLMNIIHFQASRIILPARVSGRLFEKRDSAILSFRAIYGPPNYPRSFGIQRGLKIFYPKNFWASRVKSVG